MPQAGAVGRALLLGHLVLSPLVFTRATLDNFEYNKVALLLLTAIGLAALGVTGAVGKLREMPAGAKRLVGSPVALGFVLYLASALVSTVFSVSPRTSYYGAHESFAGLVTVLGYTVLFFATRACCRNHGDGRRLLAAVVIAAALTSVYALVQVARIDPIEWIRLSGYGAYVRPFSTLGHPNLLGAYLVMALPVVVVFGWRAAVRRRWPAFGVITLVGVLAGGVIVLTLSRGAWLALVVAAAVAVVVGRPGLRRPTRTVAAGLLILPMVAALGVGVLGGSGFRASLLDRAWHLTDVTNRAHLWRASLDIFRDHPLVGCGLDTYQLAFAADHRAAYWLIEWEITPDKAHCEPLHVLATQGLLGAAALVVLIIGLIRTARRALQQAGTPDRMLVLALIAGIVGFCVQDLFSFTVAGCGTLFVTLAALLSRYADPTHDEAIAPPARPRLHLRLVQVKIWLSAAGLAFAGVIRPFQADQECARGCQIAEADQPAAVAYLERAVALDPDREILWVKLGCGTQAAAWAASEPEEHRRLLSRAQEAFERALALEPANSYNHANLGRLLAQRAHEGTGQPGPALAEYDAALAGNGQNAYFYRDACRVALEFGDLARARDYAVRGTERYPQYGPVRALLGCVALEDGRAEEAIRLHEEAFRSAWYGDDTGLLMARATMAAALFRAGRYREAAGYSRAVLECAPGAIHARLCLAGALERLGLREAAIVEYAKLMEQQDAPPAARAALERLGVRLP